MDRDSIMSYATGMDFDEFEALHAETDCKLPYPINGLRDFILASTENINSKRGKVLMAMPGSSKEAVLTRMMHEKFPETSALDYKTVRRDVLDYTKNHMEKIEKYVESEVYPRVGKVFLKY